MPEGRFWLLSLISHFGIRLSLILSILAACQAAETFMVVAEIDPDFGDGEGIPVRKRYSNGILCRSDNHLGAVFGSGAKNLRKIVRSCTCDGPESQMIRKSLSRRSRRSAKKPSGLAIPAKTTALRSRNASRSKIRSPFFRLIPFTLCRQAKTGTPGKRLSSLHLKRRRIHIPVRMGNHKSISPFEVRKRFPERAGRQDKSVSKRTAAVEQNDIQVTFERKVLKTIIEHKNIHRAAARAALPEAARSFPTHTGVRGRYSDIITGSSPKISESSAGSPIKWHDVRAASTSFRIPWSKQRDEALF